MTSAARRLRHARPVTAKDSDAAMAPRLRRRNTRGLVRLAHGVP